MLTVRIEHSVPDYEAWKQVFDSDPVGRQKAGVLRYEVLRATDDPNLVMIDLDFNTRDDAEDFLAIMRGVWGRVQGALVNEPLARVAERVETKRY